MTRNRSRHLIAPLIALGANLPSQAGSAAQTLVAAIGALAASGLDVRAVSRFYSTPCFPPGAGPDFVNAVVQAETALTPAGVLEILHEVEDRNGRARANRWGARTLDLDLLACGRTVLPSEAAFRAWFDLPPDRQASAAPSELILPHPRLQDRAFVLVPMADVAPDWRHPVTGLTVTDMLNRLPRDERDRIVPL